MVLAPLGVGGPAVEEVLAEADVVVGVWVAANLGQARVVSVSALLAERGWHIGPGHRVMNFPVLSVGPKW